MKKKEQSNRRGDNPADANGEAAKVEEGQVNVDTPTTDDARSANNDKKLDYVPARRLFHKLFILISILTCLCALWMIVGQVLGFVVYENSPVDYVLRAYIIVFCIFVVLVEIEWPAFARETTLLHNWILRGLLYVFIGVLGLQENDAVVKDGSEHYATMLEICKAVAWNMVGCGLLYLIMGVLCLQLVLNRMRTSYQARLARAKKLNSSEKQEGNDEDNESVEVALGEEKVDGNDLNAKDTDSEEIGSSARESDVEDAQDKSSTESVAKSASTMDDKESCDEKSATA